MGIKKTTEAIKHEELARFFKVSRIPQGIRWYCFLSWMKSLNSANPKVGPATQPPKKKI